MADWPKSGEGTGERGPKGEKGDKGDKGDAGAQGIQGEKGLKGDKGDKGDNGAQGIQGDPGTPGVDGKDGDKGAEGPQGPKGDKGDIGPAGENGKDGTLPEAEEWHLIGDPGEPAFEPNWSNFSESEFEPIPARFRKDELGDVVIEGFVGSPGGPGGGRVVFVLPPGYRPAGLCCFPEVSNSESFRLDILGDGSVRFVSSAIGFVTLNARFRPV